MPACLWKSHQRSMAQPPRKLNYFFTTVLGQSKCKPNDFTHHFFLSFKNSFLYDLVISVGTSTDNAATARKKVWKRNIDEIYEYEPNPIMQCRNYTLTESALISISMTMQLANSGILTVLVGVFSLLFYVQCLHHNSSQAAVIIFDNFSDKKIARDKLLQLIEYKINHGTTSRNRRLSLRTLIFLCFFLRFNLCSYCWWHYFHYFETGIFHRLYVSYQDKNEQWA